MTLLRGAVWCASLAALTGFGAVPAVAGQAPGLLRPEQVGSPGSPYARYGRALAAVVLRERTAIAVAASGSEIIEVARRNRQSASWTVTERTVGPESVRPLLTVGSNGAVTAAWLSSGRVTVASRDPLSGRWSDGEPISDGGSSAVRLAQSIDGDAIVAWIRDDRVYARLRTSGSQRFGPLQAITTEPAKLVLAESPLVVDTFGEGAIAWSEQPISDRSGSRPVLRVALRPAGDDSTWSAPEVLPVGRSTQVTAPVLGADAAGTITAAWIEDGVVRSADRTASAADWTLASSSGFISPPDLTAVALTVEPSGRAVMAAIERVGPNLSAVRVASRDGSADRWNEAGVSPATQSAGTDSLAISTTAIGDAIVVQGRGGGGGCRATVIVLANGATRRGDAADVSGLCQGVSISADPAGDAFVTGVGSDGVFRTALRPAGGLRLDFESGPPGRVRIRTSAPSAVAMTIRVGGRVVARRTAAATTSWQTVALPGRRPTGRYQVAAQATSGSATSRIATLKLNR